MPAPHTITKPKSKRLLRLVQIAALSGAYTLYHDFLKPAPDKEVHFKRFREFDKRNVVVIGSGIVGLTTAYYLSKNQKNHVTLLVEE